MLARLSAATWPIPDVAPVITTTLSFMSSFNYTISGLFCGSAPRYRKAGIDSVFPKVSRGASSRRNQSRVSPGLLQDSAMKSYFSPMKKYFAPHMRCALTSTFSTGELLDSFKEISSYEKDNRNFTYDCGLRSAQFLPTTVCYCLGHGLVYHEASHRRKAHRRMSRALAAVKTHLSPRSTPAVRLWCIRPTWAGV